MEYMSKFASLGIVRLGLFPLFSPDVAIKVIKEMYKDSIKPLGLDAFLLSEDYIQPLIEHSLNLSAFSFDESYDKAIHFLTSKQENEYYFEIIPDVN
jgi:hypothetical protein